MPDDRYEEKYTAPDLRRRLKEEIQQSDKGGRPGQWSARKAQLLAQRYEQEGGGYKGEKDEAQQSLEEWTAQDWQTVDASADADRQGEMHRYLPKKAWAMLSDKERRQAEKTKIKDDDAGNQYADWPETVRKAMTAAGFTSDDPADSLTKGDLQDFAQNLGIEGRSGMSKKELIQAIQDAEVDNRSDAALEGKTKEELYEMAQDAGIEGRSGMSKDELAKALRSNG